MNLQGSLQKTAPGLLSFGEDQPEPTDTQTRKEWVLRPQPGQLPHALHVWVVLPSEELVASIRPNHVFIHSELDIAPECSVLLGRHGEPGMGQSTTPQSATAHGGGRGWR